MLLHILSDKSFALLKSDLHYIFGNVTPERSITLLMG